MVWVELYHRFAGDHAALRRIHAGLNMVWYLGFDHYLVLGSFHGSILGPDQS
jgi:hypothetical protein